MTSGILPPILLGLLLLWIVTAVHEAGHALAIRLKGGVVQGIRVGRGPALRVDARGVGRLELGLLPVGGGILYRGIAPGTGSAVVAAAGPAANLLLAILLLPNAASVGRWIWLAPGAVVELAAQGRAWTLLNGTRLLGDALVAGGPGEWIRALGALSAIWATLNLLPIPALLPGLRRPGSAGEDGGREGRPRPRGTDGWEVLAGVVAAVAGAERGSGARSGESAEPGEDRP
jgi:membrane-associated protease RseP (regulator of RpoE activity)